jgi:hypothetical protein
MKRRKSIWSTASQQCSKKAIDRLLPSYTTKSFVEFFLQFFASDGEFFEALEKDELIDFSNFDNLLHCYA